MSWEDIIEQAGQEAEQGILAKTTSKKSQDITEKFANDAKVKGLDKVAEFRDKHKNDPNDPMKTGIEPSKTGNVYAGRWFSFGKDKDGKAVAKVKVFQGSSPVFESPKVARSYDEVESILREFHKAAVDRDPRLTKKLQEVLDANPRAARGTGSKANKAKRGLSKEEIADKISDIESSIKIADAAGDDEEVSRLTAEKEALEKLL